MSKAAELGPNIDPQAHIGDGNNISVTAVVGHSFIGNGCILGSDVVVGNGVKILDQVRIGQRSYIQDNVVVGSGFRSEGGLLVLVGARISPNNVDKHSTDARTAQRDVSVGAGVHLHDEVELGVEAIIPRQDTIAHVGNLGAKKRVVTIYGSDLGPRYSIGCQVGISYDYIESRIKSKAEAGSRSSAASYVPFLPIFNEIGVVVQTAYESASHIVEEIRAMRRELELDRRG